MERKENDTVQPDTEPPLKSGWSFDPDPLHPTCWRALRDNKSESFLLSDRKFEDIDEYTSHKLIALILKKIKENQGRRIVIVDAGGGMASTCCRGMLRHPLLCGKIKCINIDIFAKQVSREELVAEGINPDDLAVREEDFLESRGLDGSADVILSYQVLDHVSPDRITPFIGKTAQILAPGGEAYLNERWHLTDRCFFEPWQVSPLPRGFGMEVGGRHWMQKIADRHGVFMSVIYGETTLDGRTHIFGAPQAPFVYMCKKYPNGRLPEMLDFRLAWPEIEKVLDHQNQKE